MTTTGNGPRGRAPRSALTARAFAAVLIGAVICAGALVPATVALARPQVASTGVAGRLQPRADSGWDSCNSNGVDSAPSVLWTRIRQAVYAHKQIPATFWTTQANRQSIVKIVCYESSFDYRAQAGGQYGWYQMSQSLIESEGVTFDQYWNGNSSEPAGWYQCTAGELYILQRYGTPVAAWQHEGDYGWY